MPNSPFNNLLVPVDFSDGSQDVFRRSLDLVGGEEPAILVLHVIDEALIDLMSANDLGERDESISHLRKRVDERLLEFTGTEESNVQINRIVSVGLPFLEIIRKAEDFAVDAIVMGKVGSADRFETFLFGSTAEKVLRGSKRPVIVFPGPANRE